MTLHVTSDAEGLATASMRALEWLFASVRVAVDAKAARSTKGLVASWANVSVLALRVGNTMYRVQVVVMLPWVVVVVVAGRRWAISQGDRARREALRKWLLIIQIGYLWLGLRCCVAVV